MKIIAPLFFSPFDTSFSLIYISYQMSANNTGILCCRIDPCLKYVRVSLLLTSMKLPITMSYHAKNLSSQYRAYVLFILSDKLLFNNYVFVEVTFSQTCESFNPFVFHFNTLFCYTFFLK